MRLTVLLEQNRIEFNRIEYKCGWNHQSEDGKTHIEVKLEENTVWLTQQQMADLYQTSRSNITEHLLHIDEEGELDEKATCRKFRQVRQEGNRQVERELTFYNLDAIISVGYPRKVGVTNI